MTPEPRILTITRRNGDRVDFIYDAADAPVVEAHAWRASPRKQDGQYYAVTGNSPCVYLHALLAGPWADHIDGNSLDHRRSNLRAADPVGNAANRPPRSGTGFKGVTRHKCGRWQAAIAKTYLGLYATPEAAALAYNKAARERWGEFAWLNDVESGDAHEPSDRHGKH